MEQIVYLIGFYLNIKTLLECEVSVWNVKP